MFWGSCSDAVLAYVSQPAKHCVTLARPLQNNMPISRSNCFWPAPNTLSLCNRLPVPNHAVYATTLPTTIHFPGHHWLTTTPPKCSKGWQAPRISKNTLSNTKLATSFVLSLTTLVRHESLWGLVSFAATKLQLSHSRISAQAHLQ